jgi:hypothetical protein
LIKNVFPERPVRNHLLSFHEFSIWTQNIVRSRCPGAKKMLMLIIEYWVLGAQMQFLKTNFLRWCIIGCQIFKSTSGEILEYKEKYLPVFDSFCYTICVAWPW